jgi:Leucine-rich repeat (LRR) protein
LLTKLTKVFTGLVLSGITLLGCADYRFEINDRLVYSPTPLFSDFSIKDQALNNCVKQHINTEGFTAAAQMITLNCGHAGISSLAGLERFSALEGIKLSHNTISDIRPLAQLSQLKELYLDNNQVLDIGPLAVLSKLETLDLRGNSELGCTQLKHSLNSEELLIILPSHCE